jgi:hypothetical protein
MTQTKIKEMLPRIKVLNGDRTILVEQFVTTFYTVRRALDGEINTKLAFKIRDEALKLGGEIASEETQESTFKIKVFDGDRKFLKTKFKTTYYTVRKALSGETSTVLGYKIRKEALKLGGKYILPEDNEEPPQNIDKTIENE